MRPAKDVVAGKPMFVFLIVVCVLFVALWAFSYIFVSSLACANGSLNSPCSNKLPWELSGDDFSYLVAYPSMILIVLIALTWFAGPKTKG